MYICMNAHPFGQVFSLPITQQSAMFTVTCGHAHSDWQITEAFIYVIGKSYIMLTWKYKVVLDIKGKHTVYHIHIVEIPTNKRANSYKFKLSKIGNRKGRNQSILTNIEIVFLAYI